MNCLLEQFALICENFHFDLNLLYQSQLNLFLTSLKNKKISTIIIDEDTHGLFLNFLANNYMDFVNVKYLEVRNT